VGYQEARVEAAAFVVRANRQRDALERMLELSRDDLGHDLADRGLADLDGFLRLFGFTTVRDGADIVGLEFEDRLLLETDDIFRALGPYVEPGSYVLMHAGTGARWRYLFDGQAMTTRDEPGAPWYGR
jgi:hypothetical protein